MHIFKCKGKNVLNDKMRPFCVFVLGCVSLLACNISSSEKKGIDYVDPKIGNVGHLLQPTRPTVQLPNQMMRMYPLRKDHIDDQITGFPLIVLSHRLGEAFMIKPAIDSLLEDTWMERLTYDPDLEVIKPWQYTAYLVDKEITIDFVPGKKVGYYRFRFPEGHEKHLLFSPLNQGETHWEFLPGGRMAGMETYHDSIKVYLYGEFSQPGQVGTWDGGNPTNANKIRGKGVRAYVDFPEDVDEVTFSYAVSLISPEQAKRNFEHEIPGVTMKQLAGNGRQEWEKVLGQIDVQGGTEAQRRIFYTALYRTYERMVDITEDGHYYSGFDGKIHETNRSFYVDDWSWDTYLAHHPLRTILNPVMQEDMLNSYVDMYRQSGWMPTFPVLFGDHACMNGFHSTVNFLDATRKGLKNFDLQTAYEGVRKNALEATMLPWRNGPKGKLDDFYHEHGFFPALWPGADETVERVHPFEKRQAVAVTLGHSYDDWALAELAKELKKSEDYRLFHKRSYNYRTLWDSHHKLFMPKDSNGKWIPIDPKIDGGIGARDYYDENNGWTYAWQVQHDISGLIGLLGGKANAKARLDQLFREHLGMSKHAFWAQMPDATGLVGQFSMGNEPSFHIPYLYNYVGAPWKAQKRIRFLLDTWFKDNIFGIPGDEDGGGMSAFVVFSYLGFYPVTPGLPMYAIGSPVFENVSIRLSNGLSFRLIAHDSSAENKYIQSAKLNGQPLNTPWISHEDLIKGGTLEFEMGAKPNKSWGVEEP